MPRSPITFASIAGRYLSDRIVCDHYAASLTRLAGEAGPISADSLNLYLRSRLAKCSASTVKNNRTVLVSLWRWAYEAGLVDNAPRGVVRIKASRAPTRAWTQDEIRLAIARCSEYGVHRLRSGAAVGKWLKAWLLLGYEAGSRFGDLWRLTGENLDGDVIRWTQSKTGDGIHKVLSKPCVAACMEMLAQSPDGRILGWACKKRQAMRLMRSHLDLCGLVGTSKFLRRSGATHIEIISPGMATRHLGHRTATLAAMAYIDWGQVRRESPQTPSLLGDN